MSQMGMYMLKKGGYNDAKTEKALQMLLIDRKNEFRELAGVIFARLPPGIGPIEGWEKVVLNFALDVDEEFKVWTGKEPMVINSANKALTILRQLSRGKNTMNQLAHMLNISYDLAEEFKVIYRRID